MSTPISSVHRQNFATQVEVVGDFFSVMRSVFGAQTPCAQCLNIFPKAALRAARAGMIPAPAERAAAVTVWAIHDSYKRRRCCFGLQIFRTSQAVSSSTTTGNPSRPQAHSFQDTEYQRKQRQLFDALNALQAAGAQCADLEIPCIVVCGNQSAGKSSLIERITGIPLPRAKGTCTKCPMEVRGPYTSHQFVATQINPD